MHDPTLAQVSMHTMLFDLGKLEQTKSRELTSILSSFLVRLRVSDKGSREG